MIDNKTTDELLEKFLEKGGRVNKYYLQNTIFKTPVLVYLKGWYSGHNLRTALTKALSSN